MGIYQKTSHRKQQTRLKPSQLTTSLQLAMAASQQSGTEGGYAAKPSFTPHSIIGVVGDVRREMMGHHYAEKCSVFGLSSEELSTLQEQGLETKPRRYDPSTDRYQILGSPYKVMKILSEYFGYLVPTCPIDGQVFPDAGEKRTCIFTLQN